MGKHKQHRILLLLSVIILVLGYLHNVPKKISHEDELALEHIFKTSNVVGDALSFEEQIEYIDLLVNELHRKFPLFSPIEYNAKREPKDLLANGSGLCYDYSRSIEKQLMLNGFKTRHVAVFRSKKNFWTTITSKGVLSHSLSEVKTKKGWMIIDSNDSFYAQDILGEVYSYKSLKDLEQAPNWKLPIHPELAPFYKPGIEYVYGLYSRHGRFYPPYNFIPDYNFSELFYNF